MSEEEYERLRTEAFEARKKMTMLVRERIFWSGPAAEPRERFMKRDGTPVVVKDPRKHGIESLVEAGVVERAEILEPCDLCGAPAGKEPGSRHKGTCRRFSLKKKGECPKGVSK